MYVWSENNIWIENRGLTTFNFNRFAIYNLISYGKP